TFYTTCSAIDLTWRVEVPVQITIASVMVVSPRTSSVRMSSPLRSSMAATAACVSFCVWASGTSVRDGVFIGGQGGDVRRREGMQDGIGHQPAHRQPGLEAAADAAGGNVELRQLQPEPAAR